LNEEDVDNDPDVTYQENLNFINRQQTIGSGLAVQPPRPDTALSFLMQRIK
jgi:hypothetical protein